MRKIIKNWKLNRFKKRSREMQADFAYQNPNDYRSNWFKKEVKKYISNLTYNEQKELVKNTTNQYLKGFYAKAVTLDRETKRQWEAARLEREQQLEAAYAEAERKSVERKECEVKINAFGGIKCKQVGKVPYLLDELVGSLETSIILNRALEKSSMKLLPDQDHSTRNAKTIDQFEWLEANTNRPIEPDFLREIIRLRPENSPNKPRGPHPSGIKFSLSAGRRFLLIINNCCFEGDNEYRGMQAELEPYTGKIMFLRGKLAFERQYVEGVLISEANALL